MTKFCKNCEKLNPSRVGRVASVKHEVKLLTWEWWDEKTDIRQTMWRLHSRTFVSVYTGRICVGTMMLRILNKRTKKRWEICNAVVDEDVRGFGLGKLLCELAIRMAFNNGAEELYLGAELNERRDAKGKLVGYEKPNESGAAKFWKRQGFQRIPQKQYDRVMRMALDEESMVPMRLTKRMRAAKKIRSAKDIINELLPLLSKVSRHSDGVKRVPLVRLVSPDMGDIKIVKRNKNIETVAH